MTHIAQKILVLSITICLQVITYRVVLYPYVFTWGASEAETQMSLPGDSFADTISSTRAISIGAPKEEVWKWIVQLGADRGGFFSYTFIEKFLGYESREKSDLFDQTFDMEVGRIVPGSLDESKSAIIFNFPVLEVESGSYYVLENWGTFYLIELNENSTRLIVRTHEAALKDISSIIESYIGMGFHYLMERRMLIGFKSVIEQGEEPSFVADMVWLTGMLLSFVCILMQLILCRGRTNHIISIILSNLWLFPLLILTPSPLYSTGFLLITCFYLFLIIKRRQDSLF